MQEQIHGALMKAIGDTRGAFAAMLFEMTGIMVDKVDLKRSFQRGQRRDVLHRCPPRRPEGLA